MDDQNQPLSTNPTYPSQPFQPPVLDPALPSQPVAPASPIPVSPPFPVNNSPSVSSIPPLASELVNPTNYSAPLAASPTSTPPLQSAQILPETPQTVTVQSVEHPSKKSSNIPYILGFLILVLLVTAGSVYYFFFWDVASGNSELNVTSPKLNQSEQSIINLAPTESLPSASDTGTTLPDLTESDSIIDIEQDITNTEVTDSESEFDDVTTDANTL